MVIIWAKLFKKICGLKVIEQTRKCYGSNKTIKCFEVKQIVLSREPDYYFTSPMSKNVTQMPFIGS